MIAIGSDHGGYGLKQEIMAHLKEQGVEYKDYGCYDEKSCDYPVYAKKVANAIVSGECEKGILICGTGIGISITANKVKGIRAALCHDTISAQATREQGRKYTGNGCKSGRTGTCIKDCRYIFKY